MAYKEGLGTSPLVTDKLGTYLVYIIATAPDKGSSKTRQKSGTRPQKFHRSCDTNSLSMSPITQLLHHHHALPFGSASDVGTLVILPVQGMRTVSKWHVSNQS